MWPEDFSRWVASTCGCCWYHVAQPTEKTQEIPWNQRSQWHLSLITEWMPSFAFMETMERTSKCQYVGVQAKYWSIPPTRKRSLIFMRIRVFPWISINRSIYIDFHMYVSICVSTYMSTYASRNRFKVDYSVGQIQEKPWNRQWNFTCGWPCHVFTVQPGHWVPGGGALAHSVPPTRMVYLWEVAYPSDASRRLGAKTLRCLIFWWKVSQLELLSPATPQYPHIFTVFQLDNNITFPASMYDTPLFQF